MPVAFHGKQPRAGQVAGHGDGALVWGLRIDGVVDDQDIGSAVRRFHGPLDSLRSGVLRSSRRAWSGGIMLSSVETPDVVEEVYTPDAV
jgi:hypothetical protein